MHPNVERVLQAAANAGLSIEQRTFPAGTKTAQQAADAIGVAVGQIVKSLVFAVGPADETDAEGDAAAAPEPEAGVSPSGSPSRRSSARTAFGEVVVALLPGDLQLDEARLAAAAGAERCWRVDADQVRAATGFPIGGVSPLAHATPLRVFADEALLRHAEVWAAAGTWNDVFGTDPHALVRAAGATLADLHRR